MGIETEKLIAQFEARIDKFEKAFNKARGTADSSMSAIEARAARAEATLASLGSRGTPAMVGLGQASKTTSAQTGIMAAQFNDIATQLAGGQSPFLIALQQGSQITQMLGPGGAGQAVKLLGAGFMSMISPINLATIAFIGLGGAAIQYLGSLLDTGEKTGDQLEKQQQLISQVADRWGEAVPALKEYADQLQRAKDGADLQSAAQAKIEADYQPIRDVIKSLIYDFQDLVSIMQQAGTSDEAIMQVQKALSNLQEKTKENKADAEDLTKASDALASAFRDSNLPAISEMISRLGQLSAAFSQAASSAASLNKEAALALQMKFPARGSYAGQDRSPDGRIQGEGLALPEQGPAPTERPKIELEGMQWLEKGRNRAAAAAERERKAVVDLIEQLQFEHSMIGATQLEREKATALRRAGSVATAEQRAQIEMLVEATYKEKMALEESAQAMEEMKGLAKSVLGGLVSDLRAGKSGAEALANALDRVIDKLVDGALNSLIDGVFGGGSGNSFMKLFGFAEGGIAAGGRPVRRFASGGVSRSAAIFGEAGPEAAVPLPDGRRIPVDLRMAQPPKMRPSGAPVSVTFAPVIDARGADQGAVARIEKALQKQNAEFSSKVIKTVQDARIRNIRI